MKEKKIWYKSISNWLFIVACTILGIMLIINLSVMYQAKKDENVVPSVFGLKPFMVLSGSMESAIHKGDLIFTKIIDPKTLEINDVIAFRDAAGTVTTHRIIDIVIEDGETFFITKGDNNNSQDKNLVSLEDVEGLYIGRFPGIGSIMSSLSEPTTIIILVLGVTAIFVISFSISNKKQRELERQEFLEYKRSREELDDQRKNNSYEEYWEFKRRQEQSKIEKTNEVKKDEDFWLYDEEKQDAKYYDEQEDEVWDYNKVKDIDEEIVSKVNKINKHEKEINNREKTFENRNNKQQNYNKNRGNYPKYNGQKNKPNNENNKYQQDRNHNNYNKPKNNNNNNYNNSGYNKSKNYSPNRNNQNKNYGNYNQNKYNNNSYKKERPHDKEWEEFMAYKRMKEQQENNIKKD